MSSSSIDLNAKLLGSSDYQEANTEVVDGREVWIAITQRTMVMHTSHAGNQVLKVRYQSQAGKNYFEFACFGQRGRARAHAVNWWKTLGGRDPVPATAVEATNRRAELVRRIEIRVAPANNGYHNVIAVRSQPNVRAVS
jgi:hypothetical protein